MGWCFFRSVVTGLTLANVAVRGEAVASPGGGVNWSPDGSVARSTVRIVTPSRRYPRGGGSRDTGARRAFLAGLQGRRELASSLSSSTHHAMVLEKARQNEPLPLESASFARVRDRTRSEFRWERSPTIRVGGAGCDRAVDP